MSQPLNILSFSTSDLEGGSARSASRIHEGLRRLGHTSRMLVGRKTGFDTDVDTVHAQSVLAKGADRIADAVTNAAALQYFYYPSTGRVLKHPWFDAANIVQIYNTHGGYLSHRILPALARKAPIVWRLSDMWSFTGHCAYAGPCTRWQTGCGHCPDLATYPALPFDTTGFLWRDKKKLYAKAKPTIVAPSRWIYELAKQSPLYAGLDIHLIPNGVDTTIFRRVNRQSAREVLGIDSAAKVVLFAAHGLDDNPRKGSNQFVEAMKQIAPAGKNVLVALAGVGGQKLQQQLPFPSMRLGFVRDDRLMAAIYSAADVLVSPSSVENLPNVVLEAMACGCPIVATDAGGMKDAVKNGVTGYLAAPQNIEALADGISKIIGDDAARERMGLAAEDLIDKQFSLAREVKAFESLYRDLAARHATSP